MKKFIQYVGLILIFTVVMLEVYVLGILLFPANKFHSSYQSLIQDKFRILIETNDPKIIMVSGSSSAFGLVQKDLEDASGYKVVNLGLHAGFGPLFYSELAKANINEGDIVLLGYEYGWQSPSAFDSMDLSLVMTGIDSDIKMYLHVPMSKWGDIIAYLPTFAEKKESYVDVTGIYSREAFDSETGQMTMARDYNIEWDAEAYGTLDITDVHISDSSISYLRKFKKYIEDRGASVYFVAPPLLKDAVVGDYSEFEKLKEQEEELIGIPYISDPVEYLYPNTLMSNSNYHCNSTGEKVRTEMLIDDLRNAGVIG